MASLLSSQTESPKDLRQKRRLSHLHDAAARNKAWTAGARNELMRYTFVFNFCFENKASEEDNKFRTQGDCMFFREMPDCGTCIGLA